MNVLNKQQLCKLTLQRTLLIMDVLGRSGPRISNIAFGSSYCFYFFVYSVKNLPGKTYFMQTFTNYHQWRVQELRIRTIYSSWGFFSPVCSDFARSIDGLHDRFLRNQRKISHLRDELPESLRAVSGSLDKNTS